MNHSMQTRVPAVIVFAVFVGAARDAHAQTCSVHAGSCYQEENTYTGGTPAATWGIGGQATNGSGIVGQDLGSGVGVNALSYTGVGVVGLSNIITFPSVPGYCGVYGSASGTGSYGVYATSASLDAYGVYATVSGTGATGVYAQSPILGVYGNATGTGGTGVEGTGYLYGVYGSSSESTGYGVYGENTSSGYGVYGTSTSSDGVYGVAASAYSGVHGVNSSSGPAVYGQATGTGEGMYGEASSGYGVLGESSSSDGVHASSSSGYGLNAISSTGIAGNFSTTTTNAIQAANTRTDWNAAVVTALAGSSAGLSFYGNGGIEIVGTTKSTAGGSWTAISDQRVKRDVEDFHGGLSELLRVRPVSYKYNGLGGTVDDGKEHVGVLAQDLEMIFPIMVGFSKGRLHPTDVEETDIKEVNPSNFTYVLINAVQQQQQIIDRQEARIAALEANRRPLISGVGQTGIGFGLVAVASAVVVARRRRRSDDAQE